MIKYTLNRLTVAAWAAQLRKTYGFAYAAKPQRRIRRIVPPKAKHGNLLLKKAYKHKTGGKKKMSVKTRKVVII
ncbi:MAG: hypothetical protein RR263_01530, partial [Oscillospiraceae bacterium]